MYYLATYVDGLLDRIVSSCCTDTSTEGLKGGGAQLGIGSTCTTFLASLPRLSLPLHLNIFTLPNDHVRNSKNSNV